MSKAETRGARWIRPAGPERRAVEEPLPRAGSPGPGLEELFTAEGRRRVAELLALERELEERIRRRWDEAEQAIRERQGELEARHKTRLEECQAEAREARASAKKLGLADGFRAGFLRGSEEGRLIGCDEGRRQGWREGREQARKEEEAMMRAEVATALGALATAMRRLDEERQRLHAEARTGVVGLAMEIARKLVKREVREAGDPVLRNVEKAVEMIFRPASIALELHPLDAAVVEEARRERPRWAEGLERIDIRPVPEMERGGCRLTSGGGEVDLTIESQLALIEEALVGGERAAPAAGPASGPGGGAS